MGSGEDTVALPGVGREMNRLSWYNVFHAKGGEIGSAGESQKGSTSPISGGGRKFWKENLSQCQPRSIPVVMLSASV